MEEGRRGPRGAGGLQSWGGQGSGSSRAALCHGHVRQTAQTRTARSETTRCESHALRHGADDPGVKQREPRTQLGHAAPRRPFLPSTRQPTPRPRQGSGRAGRTGSRTRACTPNVLSAPAQRPSSLILKAILHFVLRFRTDCPAQHYLCMACAHWARTLSEQEGGQTRQAWTCDTCPNCLQTERLVMASAGDVETTSTYTVIRLITFLPFCLPNHTNK